MSGNKKVVKGILLILILLIMLVVINFTPTFSLHTKRMEVLQGEWVTVYYEKEKEAAEEVMEYVDAGIREIAKSLGFVEKQNINIYIYDKQISMQRKKYGFIAPFLQLHWYIGDNIGTNVILTSPANPGEYHNYDSIKEASLHEVTHAYTSVLNEEIDLWLSEGMALYLSNGEPFDRNIRDQYEVPTYQDTCTKNPIRFSNCGGYQFAHTYIEYLNVTYGWDSVIDFMKTQDYDSNFGKGKQEIYQEWVTYIRNYVFFE